MNFPGKIEIKTLEATNSRFNGDMLSMYWALYVGGSAFREWLDDIIIRREIENSGQSIGVRSYNERKKFANYVNRLGGFIDGSVANITNKGVYVTVEGGTPEQEEYYNGLNMDADGRGTTFNELVKSMLVDEMVSRFAWVNVRAGEDDPNHMYIERVNPTMVIDWDIDDDTGRLIYAKAKRMREYRENPWEQTGKYGCEWILFLDGAIATYKAYTTGTLYLDEDGEQTKEAWLVSVEDVSDYGMQMYSLVAKRAQWITDRVADTVKLLFNKELDLSFGLAEAAYPQLVLTVENRNRIEEIIKSELNVIVLEDGDKIEYLKVDPQTFTPLQANIDTLKASIHETIQSLARDAAAIPQAGRMSGETVKELRSPLDALTDSFAWPVYETLLSILKDIQKFRGDDNLVVDIDGLVDKTMLQKQQDDTEEGGDDGRESDGDTGTDSEEEARTEAEGGEPAED